MNLPTGLSGISYADLKPTSVKLAEEQYASAFCNKLIQMVNEFDEELNDDEEVGMRLVSFGQTIQFHVQDIGYYNPSLIRFFGKTEENKDIELIQHVSQISFLLMAVKRLNPEEPKRKIGFSEDEEIED